MSELLTKGQTPEAWSEALQEHGVHVSPRLIRSRAHQSGNFYKIGRLMLLTPDQMEALIKSSASSTVTDNTQEKIDG
ncbi:hypothetical protein [Roseinatronobacter monicus]|nr:hypothetical protein [Roseinatronobacter monicus]